MSHRRSRSGSPSGPVRSCTNSQNPRDMERRIFVGNLPTSLMDRKDMEELFSPYGKIHALSMFQGYGFVQFERVEDAEAAKAGQNGRPYKGYKIAINMAAERQRQNKAQSRPSPPRRDPYGGYGEGREPRPRSRSPMHGRDSRAHRGSREHSREPGREPRHPRDHHEPRDPNFDRYRTSEGREKDLRGEPRGDPRGEPRGDPRDPTFREEGYDRYYRGGADEHHRKKEDPYRDPWNGRREPEDDRVRVEERRRNELYRQYYEEVQRQYDRERPVDCSVIVVNKAQNREYAETVGRKVRDLGMVVDLIFLNTEVSLTQALEDVGRARTPFAIIITQQHQVHRSCTVNILFGTPQEHRNMPMEDAMVLVGHNYDSFKVEHREKEREEIAQKAAKMADDVLMREHEREGHPVTLLPAITLLSEGRFLTPEELDSLIEYLRVKRERIVRADPLAAHPPATAATHEPTLQAQTMPPAVHPGHAPPPHSAHSTHMSMPPAPNATSNNQQELQAKILSLFNSLPMSSASPVPKMATTPSQVPNMMGARPPMRPGPVPLGIHQGYGSPTGRMAAPQGGQRPPVSGGAGINFDNPSVQKALDTLIQSGPSLNHLVNAGNSASPRPSMGQGMGQGMGQPPPMAMYPRHY
ncbi:unnamed protein product [Oncorhynchus mykiss]|uniref:RRM domain-containing protein n=1 Tax=Oncorhynchus mykiss TaxID=8022 RepID=A0A060X5T8_ONCMY|nr:unnamed protein product [Oncorhynchus mykiss]